MRYRARVRIKKAGSNKWYRVGQSYDVTYLPSVEMYKEPKGRLIEAADIISVR